MEFNTFEVVKVREHEAVQGAMKKFDKFQTKCDLLHQ